VSRRGAVGVAIVTVGFAAGGVAFALTNDHDADRGLFGLALAVLVGVAFVSAGIVAARRRPENRTGTLMILTGLTWFLAGLEASDEPVLFTAGWVLDPLAIALLVQLVLAFPSGRLGTRVERVLAGGVYVVALGTNFGYLLFADLDAECANGCPDNVLLVTANDTAAQAVRGVASAAAVVLASGIVVVLVRRWRHATPALRRALAPVFAAGGTSTALVAANLAFQTTDAPGNGAVRWAVLLSFLAVPAAFLLGLLPSRLATDVVGRLLTETPETPTQEQAQEGLRRALRDPTLELAFWLPEREVYVDPAGQPFTIARDDSRVATPIDAEGEPLAIVVHDAALVDEPDMLRGVLAAAKLALQKDRLQAELRARLAELQRERDFVATVVNSAPAFFCVLDLEGRIERFNTTLEQVSGLADDDSVRGLDFWNVFPLADAAEAVREAIESRAEGELEHEWRSADGGSRIVSWRVTPLPEAKLLVSGADVTDRRRAEEEVKRHARFLSEVGDSTPALMIVADDRGRLGPDALNRAVVELFGYDSTEVADELFWEIFAVPEQRSEFVEIVRAAADGHPPLEHDSVWVTKEGELRDVAWSCTLMPDIVEGTRILLVSGQDITERKRYEQELFRSRARILEAGDAERRRLERNLHDGAQQRLVSLSLALRLAQNRLPEDVEGVREILSAAAAELLVALEELREIARGLHPAILSDRGLPAALDALAARSTVPVALHVLTEERLPDKVEAALFYVAAEALTNVAKYAQATEAHVRLGLVRDAVVIEIEDDGVGGADPSRGSGIHGLIDRVESLDGRLDVRSAPGGGTIVRAEVPVVREPAPAQTV